MSIVVVGSVALDTIHTPQSSHRDLVGGSAFYFSLAASHFTDVKVVAVVGDDFAPAHVELLRVRGIDVAGLQQVEGRTFRWEGRYEDDPNVRQTLRTELGVFEDFHPVLPESYRGMSALFLANIDPRLQLEVLGAAGDVDLVAVDTMNFWITGNREMVDRVIERAQVLLVNDEEAHMLTADPSTVRAAEKIRAMGPTVVVVKKGAHGAAALGPWGWLLFPALPVNDVLDPTGAGDAFAGGLLGALNGVDWRQREAFATAMATGTAVASLVVERFGVDGIARRQPEQVRARCAALREAMRFEVPSIEAQATDPATERSSREAAER